MIIYGQYKDWLNPALRRSVCSLTRRHPAARRQRLQQCCGFGNRRLQDSFHPSRSLAWSKITDLSGSQVGLLALKNSLHHPPY